MKISVKRTVALSLAMVLTLTALTAFVSCSGRDKLNRIAVGFVGAYEVYYEELRWMTMQYKDLMAANYGADIWENKDTAEKYRAELESAVFSNIISNYAVLTLCDDDMLKLNGEKLSHTVTVEILYVYSGNIRRIVNYRVLEAVSESVN